GVASEMKSSADTVQHRIDTRAKTDDLLGQLNGLLSQAAKYNVTGSVVADAIQSRADAQAAEGSGDDSKMDGAAGELKQAVEGLSSAGGPTRPKTPEGALQKPDPGSDSRTAQ